MVCSAGPTRMLMGTRGRGGLSQFSCSKNLNSWKVDRQATSALKSQHRQASCFGKWICCEYIEVHCCSQPEQVTVSDALSQRAHVPPKDATAEVSSLDREVTWCRKHISNSDPTERSELSIGCT